jgi:hypothetical protein
MRVMYEFHGWFGIAESPEEADTGSLDVIAELRARIAAIDWATGGSGGECPQRGILCAGPTAW